MQAWRLLSPIACRAFDEAWSLQETTGDNAGGWKWQDFHEAPWESAASVYQGAAMMEMAVDLMPKSYSGDPVVRDQVGHLREYLAPALCGAASRESTICSVSLGSNAGTTQRTAVR
jgi:hypothetical protein